MTKGIYQLPYEMGLGKCGKRRKSINTIDSKMSIHVQMFGYMVVMIMFMIKG